MTSYLDQPVGIIGAGSFGTAMATLLAINNEVIIFSRSNKVVDKINNEHILKGRKISNRIKGTNDLAEVANRCLLIFPVIPSEFFRGMMKLLGPHLEPRHILIHATKGFDLTNLNSELSEDGPISREQVKTMSEVISDESPVLRVGCLSGPNLAGEILDGQPTATVVASKFVEVIELGQKALSSDAFFVFGTKDIIGAELSGALKNIIALGSGLLQGKGLGKNIQAMLITRGLHEMVHFGLAMGAEKDAFLGTAGIGDLIATATSELSRNFSYGKLLGEGKSLEEATAASNEVAEGVRTLKIAYRLAKYYEIRVPITQTLYNIVYEGYKFERALDYLMRFPYTKDVDFL